MADSDLSPGGWEGGKDREGCRCILMVDWGLRLNVARMN